MRVQKCSWNKNNGWQQFSDASIKPQLVLYFAAPYMVAPSECYNELSKRYPDAHILGCTTGGEIFDNEVRDDSVAAMAIEFEKTKIRQAVVDVGQAAVSYEAGRSLGLALQGDNLQSVFVLSDGTLVNGSDLVRGLTDIIGKDIPLTGGLAGDGDRFELTMVGADNDPSKGQIAAIGLYGSSLMIGHGSVGGWDDFGPERIVTRSKGNVLYELDGKPALDLYKKYLGDEAEKLPGSALLFPLKVRPADDPSSDVVRTIVGIDEADKSMVFAGDVPEGYVAQLMRGNFENLIDGAAQAAQLAAPTAEVSGSFAVLVSCIGRKLLMGQRIDEEVEAVTEVLGDDLPMLGFYSYGEISPHVASGMCELHNQTMTITVFSEI